MTHREIPFGRPWIQTEDRAAVQRVLSGHVLTHGPEGTAFEDEFAAFAGNGCHAVALSSCMAALHLSYLALGIGPGDEVIVAAQTHVATAHAVEMAGATPVFADCDLGTGNIDPAAVRALVTDRTRAIALVHFLGIPCEMSAIMDIARGAGLRVVEDCALALGARFDGSHVGTIGDAGCFSFYPVKHITTGEGGMFITRDADLAASVRKLRAFGVDRGAASTPGGYDVPGIGLNYRMSELAAALGRSQLARIDSNLSHRELTFARLKRQIEQVEGVAVLDAANGRVSAHYSLSVLLQDRRDEVVRLMNATGAGTSIYYPHPVPRLAYYRHKYGYSADDTPRAAYISDNSISLPVGPHVSEADCDHLAGVFLEAMKEARA